MAEDIKMIEDLSLNAWPSFQLQVYDGWILRFSYFYTHRTNCAEQIGASTLPLDEKILYTEAAYRKWKSPAVFKLSPIGDPALDGKLEERGYGIEHVTAVMTQTLGMSRNVRRGTPAAELYVSERVEPAWIDALFSLKGVVSPVWRRIVPHMYEAIPMDEIAVRAVADGQVVGTGLGILDRGYVGVYAIHVDNAYRRRGIAASIVSRILTEAEARGASRAYLQVVSDNAPAKALYRTLGFADSYRYYFRVKRQTAH